MNPDLIRNYKPRDVIYSQDDLDSYIPAAVIILIHKRSDKVLFMLRSNRLEKHRGQVGLPGGHIETGESPRAAALREALEETGLHPDSVEVIGEIDRLQTFTKFFIHTFVGYWDQAEPLEADPREVEQLFEVPLSYLLDEKNCRREVWTRGELSKEIYFWDYDGFTIWGVTGEILSFLYRIIKGVDLSSILPVSESRMEEFAGGIPREDGNHPGH